MKIRLHSIFSHTPYISAILFFGVSHLVGIAIAVSEYTHATETIEVTSQKFTGPSFLLAFFIATGILLVLLKFFRKSKVFSVLFYLAIVQGILIFSYSLFEPPLSFIIIAIILFSLYWFRNVLMHNLVLTIAIGAIGAFFGLQLDPFAVVLILFVLAIYDYWAVNKTKHMVQMFKGLAAQKVHFAYIIPFETKSFYMKLRHVTPEKEFFFLGTGDVALPLILAVSSLRISLSTSLWVICGALSGYTLLYYLFLKNEGKKPMAGLPPIVFCSFIGFLIGYFS